MSIGVRWFAIQTYDATVATFEVIAIGTMLTLAMTLTGAVVVIDKVLSIAGRFQWDAGRR